MKPSTDMTAFADAGITTFDCADIYTGVEELIGRFRAHYRNLRGAEALDQHPRPHQICARSRHPSDKFRKPHVESMIDQSLRRLKTEQLDLVQFHWWDYDQPLWLETAHWLDELRRAGKIRNLGGTNFDTEHMTAIIDSGVPLISMQVQYSLLDTRPAKSMVRAINDRGVSLLCYGSVAGGFLSDRLAGRSRARGAIGKPLVHQIQAHHRRLRRLGPVPVVCLKRCGKLPTARDRCGDRSQCCRAAAPGCGGRHSRCTQPRPSRIQFAISDIALTDNDMAASMPCWLRQTALRGTSMRSSATAPVAMARS